MRRFNAILTCMLDEEQEKALQEFVARTKIPKTVIVREALRQILERYKDHKEGEPFP